MLVLDPYDAIPQTGNHMHGQKQQKDQVNDSDDALCVVIDIGLVDDLAESCNPEQLENVQQPKNASGEEQFNGQTGDQIHEEHSFEVFSDNIFLFFNLLSVGVNDSGVHLQPNVDDKEEGTPNIDDLVQDVVLALLIDFFEAQSQRNEETVENGNH